MKAISPVLALNGFENFTECARPRAQRSPNTETRRRFVEPTEFEDRCARGRAHSVKSYEAAFTLIELLIVISIIAILAGLILTVTGAVNKTKIRSKARTELNAVAMAIDNYQTKLGHYPPDNPGRPDVNQLYFELRGTKINRDAGSFETLDGSARIRTNMVNRVFGPAVTGFVNCSDVLASDESKAARPFLGELKPNQIGYTTVPAGFQEAKFLLCSVPGPVVDPTFIPQNGNRWHYVSTNPTNNPNSYDLWVDVLIAGKTNRICNWSKEPLIVGAP